MLTVMFVTFFNNVLYGLYAGVQNMKEYAQR